MRSGERAALSDIERSKNKDEMLKRGANVAISAGSAALGVTGASRLLPFLSEHIPFDLAMKGINKVNPKVGQFLQNGQKKGLDIKEGLSFLREQFAPKEEIREERKSGNPLEDFENNHTVLASLLAVRMRKGKDPIEAAKELLSMESTKNHIKNLEKQEGKNFIDYITEIFGSQGGAMQPQGQPIQPPPQPQRQPQAPIQQAQTQREDMKQNIMAALNKIMQM